MNKKGLGPQSIVGVFILFLMLWALLDPMKIVLSKIISTGGPDALIYQLIPVALAVMILGGIINTAGKGGG